MLNKFKHRSCQSEFLDDPGIPAKLLFQNLRELDFINRILGGHIITLKGIRKLVTKKNRTYHIVDLGCGSGDSMKQIARWAKAKGYTVKLTGVDKNTDAIDFMKDNCRSFTEISGIVSDYQEYINAGDPIDIIHCSLFCHHLKDDELVVLFRDLKRYTRTGFIVNDLHRNWLAYYGVKIITRLLNGSALSRNDGPISILRAFKLKEIKMLLCKAKIINYTIHWKWAFRYLVIVHNGA
jgi:ubiquinone/menaquinone biosynthesis C-methylase UbiE